MNFRTNQVLQFYVADTTAASNKPGAIILEDKGDKFWFKYVGPGGVSATDVIEKDKVMYVTAKTAAKMRIPTKKYTVSAPTNIVAGQDYVVKVHFSNYQGFGDQDMTVKVGAAHATSSESNVMGEIAWTLVKNMKSEYAPLVKVMVGSTEVTQKTTLAAAKALTGNLVIEELVQNDWVLGVTPQDPVNFEVYLAPITVDGEEILDWATVTKSVGTEVIKNGRKIADMEYFAMGERGDQYRMMGFPNIIRTKYLVDPDAEYDAITIHYYFTDANDSVQKSERDLMIVAKAGQMGADSGLASQIATATGMEVVLA